jgi:hypothetical protein
VEKVLTTSPLGFLICILAYILSTSEELSLLKMGNVFIYFSLSSSELLLLNFNAEILKHHVSHSQDFMNIKNVFLLSSTEFSSRRSFDEIKLGELRHQSQTQHVDSDDKRQQASGVDRRKDLQSKRKAIRNSHENRVLLLHDFEEPQDVKTLTTSIEKLLLV